MGLNLDLLKPYLNVVFQDVCISIGGGYAIDTRSGTEIGTNDIDGRLALISPACSFEPGSPACTCAERVQKAVDFFRRYWIQVTRSSSIEDEPLHKWLTETFTEKLDDSDFLADPELFNGRRVGEFIGNTWVGTINNIKYMNKLILLVKTNGQAHKLIEIGFSSNMACSKLRMAVKGAHPGLAAYVCELAGLEITALRRIRLGRVGLGEIAIGQWRYLIDHERF